MAAFAPLLPECISESIIACSENRNRTEFVGLLPITAGPSLMTALKKVLCRVLVLCRCCAVEADLVCVCVCVGVVPHPDWMEQKLKHRPSLASVQRQRGSSLRRRSDPKPFGTR